MAVAGAEPISAENLREALEAYRQGQREVAMAYASVDVGMRIVDGVHKALDMTVADSSGVTAEVIQGSYDEHDSVTFSFPAGGVYEVTVDVAASIYVNANPSNPNRADSMFLWDSDAQGSLVLGAPDNVFFTASTSGGHIRVRGIA